MGRRVQPPSYDRRVASRSRRHHLLPQFYLRGFADKRSQLRQVWLPGNRSATIAVTDASVIKDFNTISVEVDGDTWVTDGWEQRLAELEAIAARAFDAVLRRREWPVSGEAREGLALFAALQHLRSQHLRVAQMNVAAQVILLQTGLSGIEKLRQVMEAGLARSVADDELEAEWVDLTRPGGPTMAPDPAFHFETVERLLPGLTAQFADSGMVLWRFQRRSLITSDSPVFLMRHEGDGVWAGSGVGLATAAAFVMPLDRRTGLMITQPGMRHTLGDPSAALARSINSATIGGARRWLLHHPADAAVLDGVDLHDPVEQEVTSSFDSSMVQRDRPTAPAGRVPHAPMGDSMGHYTWPIPGRVFVNPFAPSS